MKALLTLLFSLTLLSFSFSQVFTTYYQKPDTAKFQIAHFDKWPQNVAAIIPDNRLPEKLPDFIRQHPENSGYPIYMSDKVGLNRGIRFIEDKYLITVLRFHSPGAYGINFYFENFQLGPGAEMYLVGSNFLTSYGPVTSDFNRDDGWFATDIVYDDAVYLILREPLDMQGRSKFEINQINHWYREYEGPAARVAAQQGCIGCSLPCHTNIVCTSALGYLYESNGIALIVLQQGVYQTGSLVNNSLQNLEPYILTNTHYALGHIPTALFRFNYKSTQCSTNVLSGSTVSFSGSQILQFSPESYSGGNNNDFTDYLIVKMSLATSVTKDDLICYGLSYLGWTREHTNLNSSNESATISLGTGLHHPKGAYSGVI